MTTPQRHAGTQEFREALATVDFPASRDAILQKARDRGGRDREVFHILSHLQSRTYLTKEDVEGEIERVYATVGGLPSAGPAATKGR